MNARADAQAPALGFATDRRVITACAAVLALALRVWGLTWSLPDRAHAYSYHPDEIVVLSASHTADVWHGVFNPHFFNYGSLIPYLNSLLRPLAYAALGPGLYTDYLLGRVLTVTLAVVTVVVVTLLAYRVGGPRAAWAGGLFMALAPEHVMQAHYVTVDVPATCFIALCLYSTLRWADSPVETRWLWAAGIFAGLAAGTKYNCGVVLAAPVVVSLARKASVPRLPGVPAIPMISGFTVALLVSTPGILLWPREFWRDFSFELIHTRTGHGLVFTGTAPGLVYHLVPNLLWGLGPAMFLLSAAALAWVGSGMRFNAIDPTPKTKAARQSFWIGTAAFSVVYSAIIALAQVKFQRYTLPLLPVLALFFGAAVEAWTRRTRPWVIAALGLGAIYTFIYTAVYDRLFSLSPPQDQAMAWLLANARGRTLGLTTEPWFYSPPVSPYNGGPQSRRAFFDHAAESSFRIAVVGTNAERLSSASPDHVVLSSYETDDLERLARDARFAALPEVAAYTAFKRVLQDGYSPVAVFANDPSPWLPGLVPTPLAPHDWRYPYPKITVWKRKDR